MKSVFIQTNAQAAQMVANQPVYLIKSIHLIHTNRFVHLVFVVVFDTLDVLFCSVVLLEGQGTIRRTRAALA